MTVAMGAAAEDAMRTADRPRTAVLLLAHGTPETVEQIPEYLKNVVSGREIPQHVIEEIQHRYAQIGQSPLTRWTLEQAALLEQKLGMPVYVGMRNWRPYIADTVRAMREDGITECVALCLAPQNSRTSVGLYRRAVEAEASRAGEAALRVHFVDAWATHPRLIEAFAERLLPVWREARAAVKEPAVLFTAHSVPCRTVQEAAAGQTAAGAQSGKAAEKRAPQSGPGQGPVRPTAPERSYAVPGAAAGPDPYANQSKATAMAVAAALVDEGLAAKDVYFAFQSQGASGGPWIGPTVEDTLQALRDEGRTAVVLQPIGFLCDHVEILYDIDIAFQELAGKLGLRLLRPESLNASSRLIDALTELAQEGLSKLQTTSGAAVPAV